jgi:hypothetical protein
MIKLTCIRDCDDSFVEGEDYVLLTRRGGGFVEVLRTDGHARDFIMEYDPSAPYYDILDDYFNLVPVNKRMVLFEKINNSYKFKL